jgi:prophage antirepressor-like protein
MNNPLQVFEFENKKVRIVDMDGIPAFVAKDVVEGVGAIWKGDAGSIAHIPEEWKGVCSVQTPGGTQPMTAYLMKDGSSRNMPTQRAMELKLFEMKEMTINRSDGGIDIKKMPKVTARA